MRTRYITALQDPVTKCWYLAFVTNIGNKWKYLAGWWSDEKTARENAKLYGGNLILSTDN